MEFPSHAGDEHEDLPVLLSKANIYFMYEGTELWTSFTLPRQLNMEFPSCAGDELKDLLLVLILVKTEGLVVYLVSIFET